MNNKLDSIRTNLFQLTILPDVIIFTETWLKPSTLDSELGLTGFNVYRCDRCLTGSDLTRWGGVLVAVRSCFKSKLLRLGSYSESVFVTLTMAGMKVLLAAFYGGTPDATHVEDFTTNLDIQLQQEECNEVIIAGDFNLRSLSWSNESLQATPLEYVPPAIITCTQTLIETCSFHGLAQLVPPLPSKGYTLDLIFASPGLANLVDLGESILQCDSHHAAQWVAMRGSPTGGSGAWPSPHRNFYKCDYVRLNNVGY